METELKGMYVDGGKISAVDPGLYAKRFLDFITNFSI